LAHRAIASFTDKNISSILPPLPKCEARVTWLDSILFGEAGMTFVLSGINTGSMANLAARAASRSRRVAASALAFVCAGVAVESLTFLALAPPASTMSPAAAAAMALVRTLLLASTALLAVLVLRATQRS
jgi:hypothetical protein